MRAGIYRGLASVLSLAMLSVFTVTSATTAQAATVNKQTDRIYVLNNNIENRTVGCGNNFDWLLTHAKSATYYPDVFTVQQVADQADMVDLIADLKAVWGVEYEGAIAVPNPTAANNMYPTDPGKCETQKQFQTNAVLWRKDRFTKLDQTNWNSDARVNGASCANLATVNPRQARTKNVGVALKDRVANETVVVASIHWPRHNPDAGIDAASCAGENMSEANAAVDALAAPFDKAAMRIIGGDTNAKTSIVTPGKSNTWWDSARNAGYVDPIARLCGQTAGSETAKCASHKTATVNRIDFILIEHGSTTTAGASTIAYPTTGLPYSDHRAVRATAKYLP